MGVAGSVVDWCDWEGVVDGCGWEWVALPISNSLSLLCLCRAGVGALSIHQALILNEAIKKFRL